jgi:predicted ABC-type ATPase
MSGPKIIILAGPNGAGKTTFARAFLPQEAGCVLFVNADLIAAGLSPFAPERAAIQAGRLTLEAIAEHVEKRQSFAFETTLSGMGYARQIPLWRRAGFRVELHFLSLPSADQAVHRVAGRVLQGGHDIPESTIRRRFGAGARLFATMYQPLVDQWFLYDNAGDVPVLIDRSDKPLTSPNIVKEPQRTYGGPPANDIPERDAEAEAEADAIVNGALAALRRAAQAARKLAQQTGTDLIVMRNGVITRVNPNEENEP